MILSAGEGCWEKDASAGHTGSGLPKATGMRGEYVGVNILSGFFTIKTFAICERVVARRYSGSSYAENDGTRVRSAS